MDSFREAYMAYLTPEDPSTQKYIAMLAYMEELSALMVQEHARLNTRWHCVLRISCWVDKVANNHAAWRGSSNPCPRSVRGLHDHDQQRRGASSSAEDIWAMIVHHGRLGLAQSRGRSVDGDSTTPLQACNIRPRPVLSKQRSSRAGPATANRSTPCLTGVWTVDLRCQNASISGAIKAKACGEEEWKPGTQADKPCL
jgi:hypothetical protein